MKKEPYSSHATAEFVSIAACELNRFLPGYRLQDAFAASKTELILVFAMESLRFSIRLLLDANSFFFFFYEYETERRGGALPLFKELLNQEVREVTYFKYERAFCMKLSENRTLFFKLFGAQANVLLLDDRSVTAMFRSSLQGDSGLKPEAFGMEAFCRPDDTAQEFYIKESGSGSWKLLFSKPLAPFQQVDSFFEACSLFGKKYLAAYHFTESKKQMLLHTEKELNRIRATLEKTRQALIFLKTEARNEETGHIIMANLHEMKKGMTEVQLFDFYRNELLTIKLKKNLEPQENAAYYYSKAKNQKQEEYQLNLKINEYTKRADELSRKLEQLQKAETLRQLEKEGESTPAKRKSQETDKFRNFEFIGFKIWVGKSAANNDELTLKAAHKNDMWLHAKGVSGSHVIIKHGAKPFTSDVIEYAARLAAYYSKAKGSTWVPVIYTLRKYVRKPKGAEPGQVMLEREEVILVEPKIN